VQTSFLTCHPSTPNPAIREVGVGLSRRADGVLHLEYVVRGRIDTLLIPAAGPSRRADRLWQHTCFEVFIGEPAGSQYYEFNFSPSHQWAVYGFSAYRAGMSIADRVRAPDIAARSTSDRFELEAMLYLGELPFAAANPPLRLALSAVLEHSDTTLSYWALAHGAGSPDFHDLQGFALKLEPETY
jgi:hypothetical protein